MTSLKGDHHTFLSFFYTDKNVTAHLYDPLSHEDARSVPVDARCFKKNRDIYLKLFLRIANPFSLLSEMSYHDGGILSGLRPL